jgi:uncharacterized protein YjiS (DUF1127 family)
VAETIGRDGAQARRDTPPARPEEPSMQTHSPIVSQALPPHRLRRTFAAFVSWLRACAERSAQRRALAELDDERLRDIGLTRAEARIEAARPFWWR